MGRSVTATVSKSALRHNLAQVRRISPHSKTIAMVKANAYGHGLVTVAKTLADSDALGVASIEEALLIRRAGVRTEIILMEGFFREEELPLIQSHQLTFVVHHWAQIEALKNYSGTSLPHFKVWIKVNTGMNRLGFAIEEFPEAWNALCHCPRVEFIGFMTHFSQADQKDNPFTQKQYEEFNQVIGQRKGQRCLANSAGILAWPHTHADWIRPGLILYGASPFADSTGEAFNLKPAMTLSSEIIAIRKLRQYDKVGYGGLWENTKEESKIGIISIGYGDGYPWHAKNGTPVLVNGQRMYTSGRVSMDMLAVEISDKFPVNVGDPVTLWGEGLPIEEVAAQAGTIPYELFCRFTERVTVKLIS